MLAHTDNTAGRRFKTWERWGNWIRQTFWVMSHGFCTTTLWGYQSCKHLLFQMWSSSIKVTWELGGNAPVLLNPNLDCFSHALNSKKYWYRWQREQSSAVHNLHDQETMKAPCRRLYRTFLYLVHFGVMSYQQIFEYWKIKWRGLCVLKGVVLLTESDWALWNQILLRKFTVSDKEQFNWAQWQLLLENRTSSCLYVRDVTHRSLQDISLTIF